MRVLNFLIYNFLFDKNKLLTIQNVIAIFEVIENILRKQHNLNILLKFEVIENDENDDT